LGLTAEKFIKFEGKRVYKTGDLVKYNEQGEILYIGRIDNQIKLRSNSFDRVKFVVGDLAKPQLGIDKEIYERLSSEITHIYYSASYMNSMVSYEVLRDVNVGGIKEIHRRYHFW
jgi:effector-binding domain-containing protein